MKSLSLFQFYSNGKLYGLGLGLSIYVTMNLGVSLLKKKKGGGERVEGKGKEMWMYITVTNYKITGLAQIKYSETGKVTFSVQAH